MRKWLLVAAVLVAAVALAACEPETIEVTKIVEVPKEVIVTQVVVEEGQEKIVEVTKVVVEEKEVIVEVTPTPKVAGEAVGGPGDVMRMAVLSDMTTLNIWSAYGPVNSSFWNYAVYIGMYPGAYGLTEHRWDFVPVLAADYPPPLEQEGDFWVCTVPLRDGLTWSDGSPITAADWAFTAKVSLAFDLSANWENYDGNYLDRIEAVDATTAKIYYHTKPGIARHEYGVLQAPIVPSAFWEPLVAPLLAEMEAMAGVDPASDEYVAKQQELVQQLETLDPTGEPTAGPYKHSQWEVGAYAETVKDPMYYDQMRTFSEYAGGGYKEVQGGEESSFGDVSGEPELVYTEGPWFENVLFSIYNTDAAVLALQAGEVDFILTPNGLSTGQVAQLTSPEISIAQNPANGFRYLAFNFDVPVLNNAALRQAVACMIDKQFLTQNLLQGNAIVVNTIVPESNSYWFNPDVPLYCDGFTTEERLNEAVRLMKEAGYTWDVEPSWRTDRGGSAVWGEGLKTPEGEVFPDLRLLAPSAGYDPLRATAGVYVEQWLNQLGIPAAAELVNFNYILEETSDTQGWDLYILGYGLSAFPDYACDFLYTGSGWNRGNWINDEHTVLCDELYAETDREKAREELFGIQELLAVELPYIYLFTTPIRDAWDNTTLLFPFTDMIDGIGAGYYGLQNYVQSIQ